MTLTVYEVLGHLSYTLTGLSFFMRDILLLRVLSIGACAVGIVYGYLIPSGPLWLVIFWLILFLVINVGRIIHLMLERRGVSFSEEERELYRTVFHRFAPVDFLKLIRLGAWRSAAPGEHLTRQGEALEDLKLIYNGEVVIERDGAEVARSRDGTLVGEMSYVQGGYATATVRVLRPTRYLSWPRKELRRLLKRNPAMDLAMQTVFSMDLTRKLTQASEEMGSAL
jgi:CRP-like cAMP-binding protein